MIGIKYLRHPPLGPCDLVPSTPCAPLFASLPAPDDELTILRAEDGKPLTRLRIARYL